jgi:hypothetical protein
MYLHEDLGSWSAEFFIVETIKLLRRSIMGPEGLFLDVGKTVKRSMLSRLDFLDLDRSNQADFDSNAFSLSPKAQCLINFLEKQLLEKTIGIIFV